jgi:hypothetical protein
LVKLEGIQSPSTSSRSAPDIARIGLGSMFLIFSYFASFLPDFCDILPSTYYSVACSFALGRIESSIVSFSRRRRRITEESNNLGKIGELRALSLYGAEWRFRKDVGFGVWQGKRSAKRTAAGIPTWSPTVVLICRSTAYVWQSGRDAQFSADYGRTC